MTAAMDRPGEAASAHPEVGAGTARAEPGRWTRGHLTLGHYPDGPIQSPVNILSGTQPGKVLWIQNAVHGDEPGGAIGILRFLKHCDPSTMAGTIVAVMAANPTAFRAQARNTPCDSENMNRCFPGGKGGGHTRAAAGVLLDTACSVADAVVDLHSGGIDAVVPFYSIYCNDGSAAAEESLRLARATGTPTIWACRDQWLDGAFFSNAVKRNKPAVLVECGGGGPVPEEHVENFARAIEGIARAMGILPGRPAPAPRYRTIDGCSIVHNQRGGYFEPDVRAGDIVAAGQVLGRILSPHGEVLEELVSPVGPAYVASILRAFLPVHSGIEVAETIRISDRLTA